MAIEAGGGSTVVAEVDPDAQAEADVEVDSMAMADRRGSGDGSIVDMRRGIIRLALGDGVGLIFLGQGRSSTAMDMAAERVIKSEPKSESESDPEPK